MGALRKSSRSLSHLLMSSCQLLAVTERLLDAVVMVKIKVKIEMKTKMCLPDLDTDSKNLVGHFLAHDLPFAKITNIFGRQFVKRFALFYQTVVCPVCLSVCL